MEYSTKAPCIAARGLLVSEKKFVQSYEAKCGDMLGGERRLRLLPNIDALRRPGSFRLRANDSDRVFANAFYPRIYSGVLRLRDAPLIGS